MDNQYPANTPATYLGLGAKAGSMGFAGANIARRLLGKGDPKVGFLRSTLASYLFGGLAGGVIGAHINRGGQSKTAQVKETEDIMNQELIAACEMAKIAADMSIPVEKKPAPEAGSQPVQGMTDNSTFSPTSVGASTYAGQVAQAALAKAREAAAMALSKQAGAAELAKKTMTAVKNNKKAVAGSAAALGGLKAADEYHRNREARRYGEAVATAMKEKKAAAEYYAEMEEAEYLDKLASVAEYGVAPEEAYLAAETAVDMYAECLEKMAYAEALFNEADEYFAAMESAEMEKQAAEYMPIAGSTLGSAIGATAGYVAGNRFNAPRNGAVIGAAIGGAAGSALGNFAAGLR